MADKEDYKELDLDASEIEHFVNNRVWKAIAEDVLTIGLIASEENDVLDPVANVVKLARNQGKVELAKRVVDLPRVYREEIEITKQKKEKEKKHE